MSSFALPAHPTIQPQVGLPSSAINQARPSAALGVDASQSAGGATVADIQQDAQAQAAGAPQSVSQAPVPQTQPQMQGLPPGWLPGTDPRNPLLYADGQGPVTGQVPKLAAVVADAWRNSPRLPACPCKQGGEILNRTTGSPRRSATGESGLRIFVRPHTLEGADAWPWASNRRGGPDDHAKTIYSVGNKLKPGPGAKIQKSGELSPFAAGFVDECRRRQLSDNQIVKVAAFTLRAFPELRDELAKLSWPIAAPPPSPTPPSSESLVSGSVPAPSPTVAPVMPSTEPIPNGPIELPATPPAATPPAAAPPATPPTAMPAGPAPAVKPPSLLSALGTAVGTAFKPALNAGQSVVRGVARTAQNAAAGKPPLAPASDPVDPTAPAPAATTQPSQSFFESTPMGRQFVEFADISTDPTDKAEMGQVIDQLRGAESLVQKGYKMLTGQNISFGDAVKTVPPEQLDDMKNSFEEFARASGASTRTLVHLNSFVNDSTKYDPNNPDKVLSYVDAFVQKKFPKPLTDWWMGLSGSSKNIMMGSIGLLLFAVLAMLFGGGGAMSTVGGIAGIGGLLGAGAGATNLVK